MNTRIFHSVNSGLYIWDGIAGLLVDGIHDGPEQGFSPMPAFLAGQLAAQAGLFAHVDGLLFTHLHKDHFQRTGVHRLLNGPLPPTVYAPGFPEQFASIRHIRPGMCRIQMAGAYVLAKDTVHDRAQYQKDAHQSYLIRMGGETFFIAGDAALTEEDAHAFEGFYGREVEAAFFNLYQLASPGGQAFLRILNPRRVFLIHLPFREDDRFSYRSLARQTVKHLPADLPKVEILPHMAWIDGRAAQWDHQTKGEEHHALSGIPQHGPLFQLGSGGVRL